MYLHQVYTPMEPLFRRMIAFSLVFHFAAFGIGLLWAALHAPPPRFLEVAVVDLVGGEAFAPYICMSDIALSDALGWGLKRTQTIADGCHHCDFRFKQGAATQISSKTPEVQDVIERISEKEAKQRQKGG